MDDTFDNREVGGAIASCATLLIIVTINCIKSKNQKEILLSNTFDIIRRMLDSRILLVYAALLIISVALYSSLSIIKFGQFSLITSGQDVDYIVEIVTIGSVFICRAAVARNDSSLIRETLCDEIKPIMFFTAYLSLWSLPLVVETIFQFLLIWITIAIPLIHVQSSQGSLRSCFNFLKVVLITTYLLLSFVVSTQHLADIDWPDELRTILLSIWYPVLLYIFLLLPLSHYAAAEVLYKRLTGVYGFDMRHALVISILLLDSIDYMKSFQWIDYDPCSNTIYSKSHLQKMVQDFRKRRKSRIKHNRSKYQAIIVNERKFEYDSKHIWQSRKHSYETKEILQDFSVWQKTMRLRSTDSIRDFDGWLNNILYHDIPKTNEWIYNYEEDDGSWILAGVILDAKFVYIIGYSPSSDENLYGEGSLEELNEMQLSVDDLSALEPPNWAYDDYIDKNLL